MDQLSGSAPHQSTSFTPSQVHSASQKVPYKGKDTESTDGKPIVSVHSKTSERIPDERIRDRVTQHLDSQQTYTLRATFDNKPPEVITETPATQQARLALDDKISDKYHAKMQLNSVELVNTDDSKNQKLLQTFTLSTNPDKNQTPATPETQRRQFDFQKAISDNVGADVQLLKADWIKANKNKAVLPTQPIQTSHQEIREEANKQVQEATVELELQQNRLAAMTLGLTEETPVGATPYPKSEDNRSREFRRQQALQQLEDGPAVLEKFRATPDSPSPRIVPHTAPPIFKEPGLKPGDTDGRLSTGRQSPASGERPLDGDTSFRKDDLRELSDDDDGRLSTGRQSPAPDERPLHGDTSFRKDDQRALSDDDDRLSTGRQSPAPGEHPLDTDATLQRDDQRQLSDDDDRLSTGRQSPAPGERPLDTDATLQKDDQRALSDDDDRLSTGRQSPAPGERPLDTDATLQKDDQRALSDDDDRLSTGRQSPAPDERPLHGDTSFRKDDQRALSDDDRLSTGRQSPAPGEHPLDTDATLQRDDQRQLSDDDDRLSTGRQSPAPGERPLNDDTALSSDDDQQFFDANEGLSTGRQPPAPGERPLDDDTSFRKDDQRQLSDDDDRLSTGRQSPTSFSPAPGDRPLDDGTSLHGDDDRQFSDTEEQLSTRDRQSPAPSDRPDQQMAIDEPLVSSSSEEKFDSIEDGLNQAKSELGSMESKLQELSQQQTRPHSESTSDDVTTHQRRDSSSSSSETRGSYDLAAASAEPANIQEFVKEQHQSGSTVINSDESDHFEDEDSLGYGEDPTGELSSMQRVLEPQRHALSTADNSLSMSLTGEESLPTDVVPSSTSSATQTMIGSGEKKGSELEPGVTSGGDKRTIDEKQQSIERTEQFLEKQPDGQLVSQTMQFTRISQSTNDAHISSEVDPMSGTKQRTEATLATGESSLESLSRSQERVTDETLEAISQELRKEHGTSTDETGSKASVKGTPQHQEVFTLQTLDTEVLDTEVTVQKQVQEGKNKADSGQSTGITDPQNQAGMASEEKHRSTINVRVDPAAPGYTHELASKEHSVTSREFITQSRHPKYDQLYKQGVPTRAEAATSGSFKESSKAGKATEVVKSSEPEGTTARVREFTIRYGNYNTRFSTTTQEGKTLEDFEKELLAEVKKFKASYLSRYEMKISYSSKAQGAVSEDRVSGSYNTAAPTAQPKGHADTSEQIVASLIRALKKDEPVSSPTHAETDEGSETTSL